MEWTVMLSELRAVIRNAAKHMTGFQRRKFMATMAMEHCNGSPRQTETSLGFNRRAVSRGLQELELGRPIRNRTQRRGRPRIEQHRQDISRITDEVLSENSQMDPKFQTTLAFTRVTGKGLRQALATSLNVALTSLPVPRSLRRLMNRNLNYPKLGVQHDLEKHPSNRAKTGWHISTRRQAYQSRVGRSQWLAKPNLLQAAGLARPSTAICLLFAILWVRWYVYFVPLP